MTWCHGVSSRVRGLSASDIDRAGRGDIIHKTIAIESGAHFEGSVQRQDDPLSSKKTAAASAPKPAQAAPKPAQAAAKPTGNAS